MDTIQYDAFGGCKRLERVTIPDNVTEIEAFAFGNCKNLTIYASSGSSAAEYASQNNISYVSTSEDEEEYEDDECYDEYEDEYEEDEYEEEVVVFNVVSDETRRRMRELMDYEDEY